MSRDIVEGVVQRRSEGRGAGISYYMSKVYGYMALGLLVSGVVAFLTASSPRALAIIFSTPLYWVVLFAPLICAATLGYVFSRLSPRGALLAFVAFAGIMGLSTSMIFAGFRLDSIASIFAITASIFLVMSFVGYTTKIDLTSIGSFLIMGVFGIIIASIVNIFVANSLFSTALSAIIALVFLGITAYDVQSIRMSFAEGDSTDVMAKKAVFGALRIYLDFVNIFLSLLRLFGNRR